MRKLFKLFLVCIISCLLLVGCGSSSGTMPEKLIEMSDGDIAKLNQAEGTTLMEELLDEDGALYETFGWNNNIRTTTLDTLLGYDCIYGFVGATGLREKEPRVEDYCEVYTPFYQLMFEDDAQFKEARKAIDGYLSKKVIKGIDVLETETTYQDITETCYTYIIDKSKKNVEEWKKTYRVDTDEEKALFDNKDIYKCVDVMYAHLEDEEMSPYRSLFPDNKDYCNNVCFISVYFLKLTDEQLDERLNTIHQYNIGEDKKSSLNIIDKLTGKEEVEVYTLKKQIFPNKEEVVLAEVNYDEETREFECIITDESSKEKTLIVYGYDDRDRLIKLEVKSQNKGGKSFSDDARTYGYFKYNDKDVLIEENYFCENQALASNIKNEYNSKGELIKCTSKRVIDKVESVEEYERDKQGNISISRRYRGDKLEAYTVYERDTQGFEIGYKTYNAKDELIYYGVYERDKQGREVSHKYYDAGGELQKSLTYEYDEQGNLMLAEGNTYSSMVTTRKYEYNTQGGLEKFEEYCEDELILSLAYDEQGNLLESMDDLTDFGARDVNYIYENGVCVRAEREPYSITEEYNSQGSIIKSRVWASDRIYQTQPLKVSSASRFIETTLYGCKLLKFKIQSGYISPITDYASVAPIHYWYKYEIMDFPSFW